MSTMQQLRDPAVLAGFRHWLVQHRGICRRTVECHLRYAGELIVLFGDAADKLDAACVRRALLQRVEGLSPSTARGVATSLRYFLRHLASAGFCSASLEGAVPRIPVRRLASLPQYISSEAVERTIAVCGNGRPAGIRDRAIILLLTRLGLRAGDIVELRIGDIDLRNALIRVSGKSRRQTALPLPQDVGDALVDYILNDRPKVADSRVFLCRNAPFRPFSGPSAVSVLVRRALDRAGVHTPGKRGAHVLRHSVATNLLRSGASLDAVGSLLRHRSPASTAIYAKVDVNMLAEVAEPWIGGGDPC